MKTRLFAILALCGARLLSGQASKPDPEALTATQYTLDIDFGQGTTCAGGTCPASGTIIIPTGQRFVIENISARFAFSTIAAGDVPEQALTLFLSVAGTGAITVIPFDRTVTNSVGATYYMNKNVRLYMDHAFGLPTVQVANQGTSIGPYFPNSKGQLIVTIQGHLVPTS